MGNHEEFICFIECNASTIVDVIEHLNHDYIEYAASLLFILVD